MTVRKYSEAGASITNLKLDFGNETIRLEPQKITAGFENIDGVFSEWTFMANLSEDQAKDLKERLIFLIRNKDNVRTLTMTRRTAPKRMEDEPDQDLHQFSVTRFLRPCTVSVIVCGIIVMSVGLAFRWKKSS